MRVLVSVFALVFVACSGSQNQTETATQHIPRGKDLFMKVPDKKEYYRASQISPCGAGLDSEEVLVLELNDNEDSDELMSHAVDGASLTLSPPIHVQLDGTRAQTVRRLRSILADRGCNLLVLEKGTVVSSKAIQLRGQTHVTSLVARWGSQ